MPDAACQNVSPTVDHPSVRHLTRSATHVGGATFVSRLLGFARDLLLARYFGTAAAAEAFVVAFRIPNLFRELVAEGAASAAFVPTLAATHTVKDRRYFGHVVNVLVTVVAVLLGVAVTVAVLVAPWLVRLLAPGFLRDPEKLQLTIRLTRLLLPYLWAMSIVAVTTSVLHTLQRFRAPAWNPALLNVAMIIACLVWVPRVSPTAGMTAVAISVVVAGLAQILVNELSLWRSGLRYRPEWNWRLEELRRVGELLMPRLFGAAVYQLGVLLDTVMASFAVVVGAGGVAALYYANRLLQFPLGLFGISMATVSLPTLAQQASRGELHAFKTTVGIALRSVTTVMLPATVGLFLLATPIVQLLFQHGAFDAASTRMTAWALQWCVVGLVAFAVTKIFVNALYALHDTRTPVRWAAIGLGLNVVFNVALMWPMGIGGLALGTSLAACIECVGLWRSLERRVGALDRRAFVLTCRRIGGASALMGLWVWMLWHAGAPHVGHSRLLALGWLFATMCSSIAVFIGCARWFNADEIRWLLTRHSPRA